MAEKKVPKPKFERFRTVEGTVGEFIGGGFQEITELGEEFREIYDNASEGLQQTDTNQRRDATASEIEGFSEPSTSSSILEELSASYSADYGKLYRGRVSQSRACRASNAASAIRAAGEAVQAWLDENPEIDEYGDKKEQKALLARLKKQEISADDYTEAREEAETVVSECEELADEIEGLDWPGMFG